MPSPKRAKNVNQKIRIVITKEIIEAREFDVSADGVAMAQEFIDENDDFNDNCEVEVTIV